MNLIQQQARDFIRHHQEYEYKYKEFINDVRSQLFEYRKDAYKLEFIGHLISKIKTDYDKHLLVCTAKKKEDCPKNQFYENSLFFLQEESEDIETSLDPTEFKRIERDQLSSAVNL